MGRSWELIGLSESGKALLEGKTKTGTRITIRLDLNNKVIASYSDNIWEHDRTKPHVVSKEVYKVEPQFLDQEHHLTRYTFDNGLQIEEYVQAEPWDSGPNTYVALRETVTQEPIKETLWSDKEMGLA